VIGVVVVSIGGDSCTGTHGCSTVIYDGLVSVGLELGTIWEDSYLTEGYLVLIGGFFIVIGNEVVGS
jgi:hypothetical protein